MLSLKRIVRVGVPVAALALGATLYAHVRSTDCANPSLVARAMQATGMARLQPCALLPMGDGQACLDPGRHCNIGSGAGKCTNVPDDATGNLRCQCVPTEMPRLHCADRALEGIKKEVCRSSGSLPR